MLQINVLPFEAEQLASPQSCCHLHVVHLKDAALFCLSKKRGQLLHRESFHLPMFQLRQSATLRWITGNDFLFLRQFHGRGDDLVDVPHGFGAQALSLMLALNSVHPAFFQQLLVELLQFQRSKLFQRNFPDVWLDVVVDVSSIGLVGRRPNFYLCVVFKPLVHPGTHCVLPRLGDIQALAFLDSRFQLALHLRLGAAQNVFVDGLSGLRIVPSGVPALPATVLPFSDVAFAVGPFLCHGIRLLCNDTTYHRKRK